MSIIKCDHCNNKGGRWIYEAVWDSDKREYVKISVWEACEWCEGTGWVDEDYV